MCSKLSSQCQEGNFLLDAVTELMATLDLDLRIRWANLAAAKSVNEDPENLVGRYCYQVWHGRKSPCERCPVQGTIKTGVPQEEEVESPDGRHWHIRSYPLRSPEGILEGVAELTLEITERKRTEEELRKREEHMQAILHSTSDPLVFYDSTGHPQYMNPAFSEVFGWTLNELKNQRIPFVPEDQKELTFSKIKEIYRTETPVKFDTKRLTKDNRLLDIRVSAAIIRSGFYEHYGLVVHLTDITQRKQMEEELRQSEKRYRRERDYLDNLFENSVDAIAIVDKHGRFTRWNKRAAELFGYSFDEMQYKHFSEFYADQNEMNKMLSVFRENGSIRDYEISFLTNEGSIKPCSLSISILYDEENKINGSISIMRDLTEWKKAQQRLEEKSDLLEKAKEDAEEANQAKTHILNKVMESIHYAQTIQQAILTTEDQLKKFIPESFCIWHPKDVISGDIIWSSQHRDGFATAVLDCTGHGVPGGVMTMVAVSALNRVVSEIGMDDPARVLQEVSRVVQGMLSNQDPSSFSEDGLDLGLSVYSRSRQALFFAGSRLSLFHLSNGKITEIRGDRQSLGYRSADPDYPFQTHSISIREKQCFYLCTDGIHDQVGQDSGLPLGRQRLISFLESIQDRSMADQKQALQQMFAQHQGNEEQRDDVTFVGFCLEP